MKDIKDKDVSAEKLKNSVVNWIKEWHQEVSGGKAPIVIGISGGLDSSVVAALCVEAVGKDLVHGVLLPYGKQHDISDSHDLVNHLGIQNVTLNIEASVDAELEALEGCTDNHLYLGKSVIGNIQSRARMNFLYGYSQQIGGFVSNNCNAAERFIGYSTIFGDMAGDFSPLSDLTKREVVAVGLALGLPQHLVVKVPIDGLETNADGSGRFYSDEHAMGFTYKELDDYLDFGTSGSKLSDEKIMKKHQFSEFKRYPRIAHFQKRKVIFA